MQLKAVYITKSAEEHLRKHIFQTRLLEVGGFLLGFVCRITNIKTEVIEKNEEVILFIIKSISGDCVSSAAHVDIQPSTYNRAWEEIDKSHETLVIVGWYHTHPSFGIFLSSTDKRNMKNHFQKQYHIALVIDPVNKKRGVFSWKDERLEEFLNVPYYILNGDNFRKYLDLPGESNDETGG